MTTNDNLSPVIDRLVEIKGIMSQLKTEKDLLEARLLSAAQDKLQDTKLKSVDYCGKCGVATAIIADSVKVVYPTLLKQIFGAVYNDAVTEKHDVKLSTSAARMLAGLWLGNYTKNSVTDVISGLPCGEKEKELLSKKLKGVNYETDKKNLMAIAAFDDADASDYAFFIAEAAVWDNFCQLLKAQTSNGAAPDAAAMLKLIDAAIVVEQTPKITLEAL